MSISMYYTARRKMPLDPGEISAVSAIADRYSVDERIRQYDGSSGLNWESFDFSINPKPAGFFRKGIVFSGSTNLPDNREDAIWIGVQHWCECLSEIRIALAGCDWDVTVEDHELQWDPEANAYDPSQ